jgi:tetratricopeptide (TPR) repeat protein
MDDTTPGNVMQWLATTKESWLLILDNCDNVNIDFARYIPSRGSSVIITTRLTECQIHGAWKNIDDLGPESAVQLLLKASGLEFGDQRTLLPAAESIISVLGQHALALVHAGAYIKKQHCTLSGYVELFRDEQRRLLEFKPRQQASRYGNINTTFEVSAKALACSDQHGCHLALKLLEIIAFLDHEAVEEDVFRKAFDACHKLEGECRMVWKENEIQWFQSCAVSDAGATRITKHHDGYESLDRLGTMTDMSCSWRGAYRCSSKSEVQEHKSIGTCSAVPPDKHDADEISETAEEYEEYKDDGEIDHLDIWHCDKVRSSGLVELSKGTRFRAACTRLADLSLIRFENNAISMHPLVHKWARARLGAVARRDAWEQALSVLALCPYNDMYKTTYNVRIVSHIEVCVSNRGDGSDQSRLALNVVRALYQLSWVYQCHGKAEAALAILKTLSNSYEAEPHTWSYKGEMLLRAEATCLGDLGRLDEMQSRVDRIVQSTTRWFGPGSREAYDCQLLLADTLHVAGNFRDEVVLYESLYEYNSQTSVLDELGMESLLHRQGEAHQSLGNIEQAVVLFIEALKISEKVYPVHHPKLLASAKTLADLYIEMGQAGEAVTVLENVIESGNQQIERDHSWLYFMSTLANAYEQLGKYDQAIPILEELHLHNPSVQSVDPCVPVVYMRRLAYAYLEHDKSSQAVPLLEAVIERSASVPYFFGQPATIDQCVLLGRGLSQTQQAKPGDRTV